MTHALAIREPTLSSDMRQPKYLSSRDYGPEFEGIKKFACRIHFIVVSGLLSLYNSAQRWSLGEKLQ